MAFPTQDGKKKFGSGFVAKKYDSFHPKDESMSKPFGQEKEKNPMLDAAKEGQEHEGQSPEEVVAEHGPATTVHIRHDHEGNKHHVTSTHADGHVHESDHATAKEAHEAGGKLAGADEKQENPDEAQQGAASESDGFEAPETM